MKREKDYPLVLVLFFLLTIFALAMMLPLLVENFSDLFAIP
jgi:hypothetical protein